MPSELQVASSVHPLITQEGDPQQEAITSAILRGDSISDALVDASLNSIAVRIPAMRKYALENYVLGLPNAASSSTHKVPDATLKTVLAEEFTLPYGCNINFSFCAPLTLPAIVLPYLMSVRKYRLLDANVQAIPAGWTFPETYNGDDVSVEVKVTGLTLINNNTAARITYTARAFTYDYIVNDEWATTDIPTALYTQEVTEDYTFPGEFNLGRDYYVIGYQDIDSEGVTSEIINWYYYAIGSGVHEDLEYTPGDVETNNAYPVVPVRYNNEFINSVDDPELYPSAKALLNKISISFDDLVDTLDTNPNIADIDHAYVMFGVDLQTDDSQCLGYLVEFFTYLANAGDATIWDALDTIINNGYIEKSANYWFGPDFPIAGSSSTSYIQDIFDSTETASTAITSPSEFLSLKEHGLNITLSYDSITSVVITGEIDAVVGETNKEIILPEYTRDEKNDLLEINPSVLILRKRLSENLYREVRVTNLVHKNTVHDGMAIKTTPENILDDPDNHNLIIPLHHDTVMTLPFMERKSFYEKTLFLVINSYERVHVSWYATSLFGAVISFVGLVFAFWTGGLSSYLSGVVASVSAAAAAGLIALVQCLAWGVLQSVIVSVVLKEIVKLLGPELAAILGAVMAAYGLGFAKNFAISGLLTVTPAHLLTIGTQLVSATVDYVGDLLGELYSDYEEFLEYTDTKWAELEKAREEMFPENPFALDLVYGSPNRKGLTFNTNPDLLYSSVHRGNPGTLVYDAMANYVNLSLLLPDEREIT